MQDGKDSGRRKPDRHDNRGQSCILFQTRNVWSHCQHPRLEHEILPHLYAQLHSYPPRQHAQCRTWQICKNKLHEDNFAGEIDAQLERLQ